MSTLVLMPTLSPTMSHGKLSKWLKPEGSKVLIGDVIAEIETDKAIMEIEAVDEGILSEYLVKEGDENISVNQPIAVISIDGDDVDIQSFKKTKKIHKNNGLNDLVKSNNDLKSVDSSLPILAPLNSTRITVRQALNDAISEEMRLDPDVFLLGEEVAEYQGAYKVSQGLLKEFGEKRVIDTPITEYGFTHLGIGAAYAGLKPIVEFMTFNFALQAMDAIVNSAAKTLYMSGGQMPVPIVFRGPNGAASRVAAQHSQDFASWFAHIPGLKVVAPYSASDAKGLLKSSIRDPNPVVFLENELLYGKEFEVPDGEYLVPIGKASILNEGEDVTIVSYSIAVAHALDAASILKDEGISAEVIDLRSLRPLDTETIIKSVQKTNRLVVVEEGWPVAGIGSEIIAVIMENAFDYLDAPARRVSSKDVPLPYAANLEKMALPTPLDVVNAVKEVCNQ